MRCDYCDKGHDDNAGGYYDRKACEVRFVQQRLEYNEIERKSLLQQLEQARYVGD